MARSFNHAEAERELGYKNFVKTKEWNLGDTRRYWYNGHEVVDRQTKAGDWYKAMHIYLLDEVDRVEWVLEISGITYSQSFKASGCGQYDLVEVTKQEQEYTKKDGTKAMGITYDVVVDPKVKLDIAAKNELGTKNWEDKPAVVAKPINPDAEINIDDIPF